MTSNDINDMMLYGERINIEYKEATNELPKSVWEAYYGEETYNSHITYAEIGKTLSLGETSVYKILKHLREKNLIYRKSGRVYGYWVVNNSESSEK